MATCDYPTDLIHRITYPPLQKPGLRIDSRVATIPLKENKQLPASSSQQEIECSLFREIESGRNLRRNPAAGVGGLVLQLLVLAVVVVIPLYHTDPLPKKEMLTMLYLQPPPAPPAGSPTKFQAPKPTSTYVPTSTGITAPAPKTQEAAPTPVGTDGGLVGGVPGGVVGGIPGGVLGQVLSSTGNVPVPAKRLDPMPVKRIRVASRVVEANLIHDVAPEYPTEAGRSRIEGIVVLMAVIDKDGTVKDVRVESGLPILAQAAIEAVKQWRYKPYTINGEPVEVDSRITINFTLSAS